jgi:pimeloyl-ACP methyl ester carboxylesterase
VERRSEVLVGSTDGNPGPDSLSPETSTPATGLRDRSLRRADGRTVAWAEVGPEDGRAIVSFPGTPTSRYAIRSDLRADLERNVRMIVTERPGFGASTRLAGHGFLAPADDVAAILDELEIERAHLWGGSGGAPYLLAFAQRHADRALAATVVSGSAPLNDDEIDDTIPMNAEFSRAALVGDVERLGELAAVRRKAILADPLAGFRAVMDSAPEADRRVMADPGWQGDLITIARESLRQGVDGWVDELIALAPCSACRRACSPDLTMDSWRKRAKRVAPGRRVGPRARRGPGRRPDEGRPRPGTTPAPRAGWSGTRRGAAHRRTA